MMQSQDRRGPLVNRRIEKLYTWVDPLGYRENFRYEFELEVFDHIETEATCSVKINGRKVEANDVFSDYYGLGKSIIDPLEIARKRISEYAGSKAEITVIATILTEPVFLDPKNKPFYNSSVRCFSLPWSWRRQDENLPALSQKKTFEIFANGDFTPAHDAFQMALAAARDADLGAPWRSGQLR